MKKYRLNKWLLVVLCAWAFFIFQIGVSHQTVSAATIIDHTCTNLASIPQSWLQSAKDNLHIAYGHTSHGSQLTDGMSGLVGFINDGGLGLSFPNNFFAWNNGGNGGALDLHDYAMGGDVGYYPAWVSNTRDYLGDPDAATGRGTGSHADVNVIIWSWCGQVSSKYAAGTLSAEYLNPMVQLENDYPGIKFIYMTGHVDHWNDANNKAANNVIRTFCNANNKILYDFADIESYDPDGVFYEFPNDSCDYYASINGALLGNWATEWQNTHDEDEDWYDCGSAHSQPLNANRKAYAAWWLWARLAGWDGNTGPSYTITGTITYNNAGLPNVIMNGLPGNPTTNASGQYTATVPDGWDGTAAPALAGYTFSPINRAYSDVAADQTAQDYTATLNTYTISGTVTYNGNPMAGVTLTGLPGNPVVTNASGFYTTTVNYGWAGTVTPTLTGYSFAPPNRTYSNISADQTAQNFAATLRTYSISGTVTYNGTGLAGVTINNLPGNPVTNASGFYTATVTHGWSGTATPSLSVYTFNPVNRSYTNITANQSAQNFTATLPTYTISGIITYNGNGLAGVTMNGLPNSPNTNASGRYADTVTHGSTVTVTPSLTGYSFNPASNTHSNVTADQTQNYTAAQSQNYEISGRVTRNGSGLPGVTMNGFSGIVTTNANGDYTATVARGSTVTVRPVLSGYSFNPVNQTHVNVMADLANQNFIATANSSMTPPEAGGGGGGCFLTASASGSSVTCLLLLLAGLILSRSRPMSKKDYPQTPEYY